MATQHSDRRIVGAIISGGHIYKAGEEAALAKRLGPRSIHRLMAEGQIAGNWLEQPETPSEVEDDGTDADEQDELPPLAEMEAHLAAITDIDQLTALQQQDKRKGAKPLYKARLAELQGGE